MSGTITCCKDCEKRYVGCHSSCEEYNEQKKRHVELNKVMRQHEQNREAIYDLKKKFISVYNNKKKR